MAGTVQPPKMRQATPSIGIDSQEALRLRLEAWIEAKQVCSPRTLPAKHRCTSASITSHTPLSASPRLAKSEHSKPSGGSRVASCRASIRSPKNEASKAVGGNRRGLCHVAQQGECADKFSGGPICACKSSSMSAEKENRKPIRQSQQKNDRITRTPSVRKGAPPDLAPLRMSLAPDEEVRILPESLSTSVADAAATCRETPTPRMVDDSPGSEDCHPRLTRVASRADLSLYPGTKDCNGRLQRRYSIEDMYGFDPEKVAELVDRGCAEMSLAEAPCNDEEQEGS